MRELQMVDLTLQQRLYIYTQMNKYTLDPKRLFSEDVDDEPPFGKDEASFVH
jgi:hypothetical protein